MDNIHNHSIINGYKQSGIVKAVSNDTMIEIEDGGASADSVIIVDTDGDEQEINLDINKDNLELQIKHLNEVTNGGNVHMETKLQLKQASSLSSFGTNKKRNKKVSQLLYLSKKLTILTGVGVGSTFMSMIVVYVFGAAIVWYVVLF